MVPNISLAQPDAMPLRCLLPAARNAALQASRIALGEVLANPSDLPEGPSAAVAAAYEDAAKVCGEAPGSGSLDTVPALAMQEIEAMLAPGGGTVRWGRQELSIANDTTIVVVAGVIVGGPTDGAVVIEGVLPVEHFKLASKTRSPYLGSTAEGRSLLLLAAIAREQGKPAPLLVARKQSKRQWRSLSPRNATKEFVVISLAGCKLPGGGQVSHALGWLQLGRHWQVALLGPPVAGRAPVARARSYTCTAAVTFAVATQCTATFSNAALGGAVVAQYLLFGAGTPKVMVLRASAAGGSRAARAGLARLEAFAKQLVDDHGAKAAKWRGYDDSGKRLRSQSFRRVGVLQALRSERGAVVAGALPKTRGRRAEALTVRVQRGAEPRHLIVTKVCGEHGHAASPTAALSQTMPLRAISKEDKGAIGERLASGGVSIADAQLELFRERKIHST